GYLTLRHWCCPEGPPHHAARASFPTRRSSDLLEGPVSAVLLSELEDRHGGVRAETAQQQVGRVLLRPALVLGRGRVLLHRISFEDRKSTRLNSSHVKISYAVFCLRKKIVAATH